MMRQKISLYKHQNIALKRALKEPFFALFMEQGTGKTPVAIKAIETRYKQGLVQRVVIFAPAAILYNWELELNKFLDIPQKDIIIERLNHRRKNKREDAFQSFIRRDPSLMTLKELRQKKGYKGKKKDIFKTFKPKLLILLVNYEKARVMYKPFRKFKPQFLIVDESHKLRNRTAQMSKNIYRLTRIAPYRLIMTGTPICNGYEDLFMQYKIMDENLLGSEYKYFEEKYVIKGGYMGHDVVGYRNEDKLKKLMKDTSFRIRLDECVQLPPLNTKFLSCELNPKAQKIYNEMNDKMLAQIEELANEIPRKQLKDICKQQGIVFSNKESYTSLFMKVKDFISTASCDLLITKIMRLQQITGGFLTLDSGDIVPISQDKLQVLKDVVLEASQPVVVFCQYVPEIELITGELSKIKRGKKNLVVRNYSQTKQRDEIYKEFQEGKVDVLVLQLRSGSVGLNLQRANKLVFYSWSYSADDYVQAIARIKRNGQKNSMEIIHIIAEDTRDSEILDIVKNKLLLAKKLLD